jgi:hypothetical protein
MRRTVALAVSSLVLALSFGCGHVERAAAKDPQKCERDPKCQRRDRMNDCSTQCVDDPACMDRCQQFNQQTGTGGR